MSILVHYQQSDDREAAEKIAEHIDNNYSYTSFATGGSSVDISSFDGVIVVGGQNANSIYQNFVNRGDFPKLTCDGSNEWFNFDNQANRGVITDITLYQQTPVQGVAGCFKEDTLVLSQKYIGKDVTDAFLSNLTNFSVVDLGSSFADLVIPAKVNNFVNKVEEQKRDDSTEDPTEPDDPVDTEPDEPINTQPDDGSNDSSIPDMPVTLEIEGTSLNFPDSENYSFTVDGWAKEVDSKFGTEHPEDKPYENKTFEGLTGGGDKDIYQLSKDAVITKFSADQNKYVYINGNRYKYNAQKEKFEGAGIPLFQPGADDEAGKVIDDDQKTDDTIDEENKQEENKEMSSFDKLVDSLVNPFKSPQNTARFAAIILLVLVALRSLGIVESISE